ncbi:hypothetical protein E9J33_003475 [Escherichia coli]|nr:hypothetical protein [Escherichia coli]EES3300740.1 hypothetical protein [Escherichia coli]EET8151752.1 hypothetical protein [Escherichia coli]EEY0519081.1 hypothetical protein [Escherichia coli]EEY9330175.1 hypothetical protein [Escherichia coli]
MSVTDVVVPATATATATVLLFPAALILTTAVLSRLPGAPSAPGCRAHLRLPAAWRHPVVRLDSDRQLLAHLPVSAEPAGAVSGCRYGPMRENPGFAATGTVAPPLSRRGLRSWHPGKKTPGCKEQRRFANRASRRCGGCLPVVVSGAIHLFKPLSPGADTATTCRTDCPG